MIALKIIKHILLKSNMLTKVLHLPVLSRTILLKNEFDPGYFENTELLLTCYVYKPRTKEARIKQKLIMSYKVSS